MIPRDNRESSIEALQLATAYVMISSIGSNRLNQTKNHTMTTTIKVSTRSAYGQTYVDVIDDTTRKALQTLTGQETLTQRNINALKVVHSSLCSGIGFFDPLNSEVNNPVIFLGLLSLWNLYVL